jgi:lambda family phage portal protein
VKTSNKPRIKKVPSGGGFEQNQRLKAFYEGASTGPRMGNKGLRSSGPNSDAESSLTKLRSRSRHAVTNHPLGVTANNAYVDNLVGNGIVANWENKELQRLWNIWQTECDADGNLNFPGMEALVARAEFSDGEVLIRRRWRRPSDGLSVPLQIEIIESDHLPTSLNDIAKGIRLGIQKNFIGQRTHYHLYKYHPSDLPNGSGLNDIHPVPASDIIHYFQVLRPKQDRGIPHLSTILLRLYEIDEMQDATLVKQKTAQLFAWIIKKRQQEWSEEGSGDGETVGDGNDSNVDYDEIVNGEAIKKIKPASINYLDDDEDIEFSSPDGIGPNYVEWIKTELRTVAKAIGLTYEMLTGDLTGVNYSSIRAGLVEFRRRMERLQYHLMIFKFCHPVAKWFLEAVWMNRLVDLPEYSTNPHQYLPKWQTPRWDWVDPLKDVMADILEVRAGFDSRANKNAERGHNSEDITAQLIIEQGVKSAEELVLDTNPGKVNKAGTDQGGMQVLAIEQS